MAEAKDTATLISNDEAKLGMCLAALQEADFDVGVGAEFDCVHIDLAPGSMAAFFRKLNSLGPNIKQANLARARYRGARYFLIRIS